MRCHICDKALSEAEIVYLSQDKSFECCSTCLEVALDAAYSDGFLPEDPPEEVELAGDGAIELLIDDDAYRSYYDHSDAYQSNRTGQDEPD